MHSFSRWVIENRKNDILNGGTNESNEKSKIFLKLLIDDHLKNDKEMTEEDIREEVDTFMFEGQDTTAMALSWIIFILGHHRNVQAKAQAEIDFFVSEKFDSKINLGQLKQLKYLECCIKEGLRLFPSVPLIGRHLEHDLIIENRYKIPKGTNVFVHIYMLHRDPKVYPNPEQYNPDRFMDGNSDGRNPFSFIPFSAGPRNCIGQKYAMTEMKTILVYLLKNFKFESIDHLDKIKFQIELVLRPKCPLNVKFMRRNL